MQEFNNVWVVQRNLENQGSEIKDDNEATAYAKRMSRTAMCTVIENRFGKVFVYENEEVVNENRKAHIFKVIEDHSTMKMNAEQRITRGKRSVKKQ